MMVEGRRRLCARAVAPVAPVAPVADQSDGGNPRIAQLRSQASMTVTKGKLLKELPPLVGMTEPNGLSGYLEKIEAIDLTKSQYKNPFISSDGIRKSKT
jgi:hypothetical protein